MRLFLFIIFHVNGLKKSKFDKANKYHTIKRAEKPISIRDGVMVTMNRAECSGYLEDNIKSLETEVLSSVVVPSRVVEHMKAIHSVGLFLLQNGPIVLTRDAINILYSSSPGKQSLKYTANLSPCSFYETISRHLNILQAYQ